MRNENRIVVGCDVQAAAPADAVFPLLCPVREYDWIEGWQCEVVCSVSGSAENNCIFTTERSGEGRRVWVVSRYEPPKAIEFVTFQDDHSVVRLDLYLSETGDGNTRVRVTHTITPLNAKGKAVMDHLDAESIRTRWRHLETALNHYLQTGQMQEQG